MARAPRSESTKPGGAHDSPWPARLEWLAAVLSALVVIGLAGTLLMEALNGSETPPELSVTLEPPVAEGQNLHLRFTVGAALIVGEGRPSRRVTIDYVPPRSEVTGGFYVDPDEMSPGPVAVIEGYVDP